MITISTSGGFAGLGAGRAQKSVDTNDLEGTLRGEACRRFDPAELARLSAEKERPEAADRLTYHITVTDEGGTPHRFDIAEGAIPAEMLDIIDEL